MNELRRDAARPAREVPLIDEGDAQSAYGGIQRNPGAGDAATKNQQVKACSESFDGSLHSHPARQQHPQPIHIARPEWIMERIILPCVDATMPNCLAFLRICLRTAGLLLALSLLTSSAHAQCNHASGRAFRGDFDSFVPVSRSAKNDAERAENRQPT